MNFEVETRYFNNRDDIDEAAGKYSDGLSMLGEGMYAQVFGSNQTPYVIKIMSVNDIGYAAWMKVIAEFGHEIAYMPKIHHVIQLKLSNPGSVGRPSNVEKIIICMEKLVHPKRNCDDNNRWFTIDRYCSKLKELLYEAQHERLIYQRLRPKHRDLITVLMLAKELSGCDRFDLHSANIMKRGKQYVVTDPISH